MGIDSVGIAARDISLEFCKNRLYKYPVGVFMVYLPWNKAKRHFGLLRSFPILCFNVHMYFEDEFYWEIFSLQIG